MRRADVEARFRTLVQSPLRAGLLRFLSARPDEPFDVESLMATFGRMRLDVENCLNELVDFGIVAARARSTGAVLGASVPRATPSTACSTRSSSGAPTSAPKTRRRRSSASAK